MQARTCRTIAPWALWVGVLLPAAWGAGAEPLRFCITADSHGKKEFVGVAGEIKRLPGGCGAFMISAGDVNPPQTTREQLDEVFGPSLPWYSAVGNHETAGSSQGSSRALRYLHEYFDEHIRGKANPGPAGSEKTTYSFDAGEVHVVVINEYWDGTTDPNGEGRLDGDVVARLRAWLAGDLKASAKCWKLVVAHEPAFPREDSNWTGTRHATSSLNKYKDNRDSFWKVLEDQGATAYVCGHTHRYSRYRPEGSKVWQINTAQAGSSTSWKYVAFLIVTADRSRLKFDTYRSLKQKDKFELADSLSLEAPAGPTTRSGESRRDGADSPRTGR